MAIKAAVPCPGYTSPDGFSNKPVWIGDVQGNNNYQQTGDLYTASQFGMSGIEMVKAHRYSQSLNYYAVPLLPANSQSTTEKIAPTPANFTLRWFHANGTEASNNDNLAAEILRLEVNGV